MKNESTNARQLHKKRAFVYEQTENYDKKFIDPKTNKHFAKYTRLQACPVCKSKKYINIFTKDGGTYVKCASCTHVYTNPVLTDAALELYYKNADAQHGAVAKNESAFFREMYTLGLQAIQKSVRPGSILDVGCSTGFFLDLAREKGWKTTGTELDIAVAPIAEKSGHRVYTQPLEKIKFDEKFDAIAMWDVFEHLVHARESLQMFKKLLKKDGVIFMHMPNVASLAVRIMRDDSHTFGTGHVNLYSPDTITLLAQKCGYDVLYLKTVISEAAVLENYLNYEDPYFGNVPFKGKVLGFISPEDIHKHKLGHKMQVVLRPKQ